MSSILRGLLRTPASAILVKKEPLESTGIARQHPPSCSAQWNRRKESHDEIRVNSVSNIKCEEQISEDLFNNAVQGVYYSYSNEPPSADQTQVSPLPLQNCPSKDRRYRYQYRFANPGMSLSLQHQVSPSEVPDLLGCYGYEESLLTPPEFLDYPKPSFAEQLSLADCGGVMDAAYEDALGPDWLSESMALHTPDEQEGDVLFTPANYLPLSMHHETSQPTTPLFTPTTPLSCAPSPLSTSPEVDEVLSLFSEGSNSLDSTDFNTANEYLPFGSYDEPSLTSPELTPVTSPLYYQPSEPQPEPSTPAPPKPRKKLSQAAKKERKRLQNKTAALRYRQKKKEEKNGSVSKLEDLETRNAELKRTVTSITAEIEYLKKLWSEVQAAKSTRC